MVCFAWLAHVLRTSSRRSKVVELDSDLIFFDCVETEAELKALIESDGKLDSSDACNDRAPRSDAKDAAAKVLELALQEFGQRVGDACRSSTECEWATLGCAARMMRATLEDSQKAVSLLAQALEVRRKERRLYGLTYAPRSDAFVIAKNLQGRPILYLSTRSVNGSLRNFKDQFVLAFEAACHVAGEDGYVDFVCDMYGMKVSQFCDLACMKETAALCGTVYTERIRHISIVDFACTAQVAWRMAKPLMDPETSQKIAFVGRRQCQDSLRSQVHESDFRKICRTFDIVRDAASTSEERDLHARNTAFVHSAPQ